MINKYAEDEGFNLKNLGLTGFANIPSLAVLGAGGYGLAKLLGMKKKRYLAAGLPLAYAAYLLGHKGNGGLNLWNGFNAVDAPAAGINYAGYGIPYWLIKGLSHSFTNEELPTGAQLGKIFLKEYKDVFK